MMAVTDERTMHGARPQADAAQRNMQHARIM
jgi:hypothetical protein